MREELGVHAAIATSRSLRGALARVELAASQLARDVATPRARALLRSISVAVADLDRGLAALAASPGRGAQPRCPEAVPVAPLLTTIVERLRPALAARGLHLEAAVAEAETALAGEPQALRRAALLLLRCVAAGLATGGGLTLAAEQAPDDGALVLAVEAAGPARDGASDAAARSALRTLVAAQGASLEHEERRDGALRRERLAVRFASGEVACSGS